MQFKVMQLMGVEQRKEISIGSPMLIMLEQKGFQSTLG
jgi:hypothetical protein